MIMNELVNLQLSMKRFFLYALLYAGVSSASFAVAPGQVRYHNEASDTARINTLLIEGHNRHFANPGEAIQWYGMKFIDVPYVAHTLEGDPEMLTVNIDELDCTTFVETVLALTLTTEENRQSWRDFLYNLERVRYRDGRIDGYPSRLHYNSDWAVDNTHRGNFTEVTNRFPFCNYTVKTLDFMSANASKYSALADSANLAGIKNMEVKFRSHRYPYIKTVDLDKKPTKAAFRTGDIIAFTTNLPNLDTTHMGIVVMKEGEPYVLHASMSAGKVVVTDKPLAAFVKRNRSMTGVRVFRIIE